MADDLNVSLVLKLVHKATRPMRDVMGRLKKTDMEMTERAAARNRAIARGGAAAATGLIAIGGAAIREAMQIETAMADVAKALDMDTSGIKELSDGVLELSTNSPMAAEEIAALVTAAAEAKLVDSALPDDEERQALLEFAEAAAQIGVAFDLTANQAAAFQEAAITRMGLSRDEALDLADAVNQVSKNAGAKAREIADVIGRFGSVAGQAGLAAEEIAALSGAFVQAASSPKTAATAMNNFFKPLTKGEAATKSEAAALRELGFEATELAERMQVDAKGAIEDVLRAIDRLEDSKRLSTLNQLFDGESVGVIAGLVTNIEEVPRLFDVVAERGQYAGSALEEYAIKSETTAANLRRTMNNISALMAKLGEELLPAVNAGLDSVIWALEAVDRAGDATKAWIADLRAEFEGLSLYEAGVKIVESQGAGMWSVLTGMVAEIKAKLAEIVPGWMQRAWTWASGDGDAAAGASAPPGRALGGPVRAGVAYEWQEEGREMFVPATDGRVMSNREVRTLERQGAAVRNVTFNASFNITAAPGMSAREVAETVERRLRRFATENVGLELHDGGLYA
jgi:TP901 family phage tail tape measure protein